MITNYKQGNQGSCWKTQCLVPGRILQLRNQNSVVSMCLPASSGTADGYYVSETDIAPARLGSKPGPFFWSKSSYLLTNPSKTPPIQHQLAKLEKVPINRESSRYRTSPVATKAFRTCRIVALEPRMKTGPMTDFVGTEEDLPPQKKTHPTAGVFHCFPVPLCASNVRFPIRTSKSMAERTSLETQVNKESGFETISVIYFQFNTKTVLCKAILGVRSAEVLIERNQSPWALQISKAHYDTIKLLSCCSVVNSDQQET